METLKDFVIYYMTFFKWAAVYLVIGLVASVLDAFFECSNESEAQKASLLIILWPIMAVALMLLRFYPYIQRKGMEWRRRRGTFVP